MLLIAPDGYYPDSPQKSSVVARSYPCLPSATNCAAWERTTPAANGMAREPENAQATGRLRKWWQVLCGGRCWVRTNAG